MNAPTSIFDEFKRQVDNLRTSLEASHPRPDSTEAYPLTHVRLLSDNARRSYSFDEVRNSARALSKFCVDSMNWDSPLFKRCEALTATVFKHAK